MGQYKKGDWVRCTDNSGAAGLLKMGAVYEVDRVNDIYIFIDGIGGMTKWRFEPWQPKVGERVRCIRGTSIVGVGKVYTVVNGGRAPAGKNEFFVDTGEHGALDYNAEYFEPVTDPLPVAEQPAARENAGGGFKAGDKIELIECAVEDLRSIGDVYEAVAHKGPAHKDSVCFIGNNGEITWAPGKYFKLHNPPISTNLAATVDAINDEYGPVVPTTAAADKPKFKVGDRVVAKGVPQAGVGIVESITARGEYKVNFKHTWYSTCTETDETIKHAPIPTTAIVALIDNGQPLPATRPAVHTSAEAADAEARRLAGVHKGQEFGVFVLTGATHKEAKVYEHEWQRLAAEGERIRAIKELRAITGMYLKSAKTAVDDFLAAA